MRMVFVMSKSPWPLTGGQEVIAHHTIQALINAGHNIDILLTDPNHNDSAWPLNSNVTIHNITPSNTHKFPSAYGHKRWMRYWGINPALPDSVARTIANLQPDYIECIGQQIAPLMYHVKSLLPHTPVAWMAADDWCLYHLTHIKSCTGVSSKTKELLQAIRMAAYQRYYRNCFDVVYAVAEPDAKAMRQFSRLNNVVVCPNGVDSKHFSPNLNIKTKSESASFWGRLDFTPNIQAVKTICKLWNKITPIHPNAICDIVGPGADNQLIQLIQSTNGVNYIGEVDNIRDQVLPTQIALLPMSTGGGIKNKLLEAAAMGMAIITTNHGCSGLNFGGQQPWIVANDDNQLIQSLSNLWSHPQRINNIGMCARQWVIDNYCWDHVACVREAIISRFSNQTIHTGVAA